MFAKDCPENNFRGFVMTEYERIQKLAKPIKVRRNGLCQRMDFSNHLILFGNGETTNHRYQRCRNNAEDCKK